LIRRVGFGFAREVVKNQSGLTTFVFDKVTPHFIIETNNKNFGNFQYGSFEGVESIKKSCLKALKGCY